MDLYVQDVADILDQIKAQGKKVNTQSWWFCTGASWRASEARKTLSGLFNQDSRYLYAP